MNHKKLIDENPNLINEPWSICITNVHKHASADKLKLTFEKYGEILSYKSKKEGMWFIEYDSYEAAENAVRYLNNKNQTAFVNYEYLKEWGSITVEIAKNQRWLQKKSTTLSKLQKKKDSKAKTPDIRRRKTLDSISAKKLLQQITSVNKESKNPEKENNNNDKEILEFIKASLFLYNLQLLKCLHKSVEKYSKF